MLGSEYITEAEYNQAMSETLVLASSAGDLPTDSDNPASKTKINNYFTDTVIKNVISDLQKKYDYSYSEARKYDLFRRTQDLFHHEQAGSGKS